MHLRLIPRPSFPLARLDSGILSIISVKHLADVLVAYAKEEPGFESLGWKSKGAHDYATFGSHPRAIDGFA